VTRVFAALVALAALAFASSAVAAPRAYRPWTDPPLLPVDPDSAWGRRLAAQQAEAARSGQPEGPEGSAWTWAAANFAALGKPKWEILHQDITVDLQAAKSELAISIKATIRANDPVDSLSLLITNLPKVEVSSPDGPPLKVSSTELQGYTALTVDLPAPVTAASQFTLHVSGVAKLSCGALGPGLLPCGLGGTYQWVTFARYYLTPAAAHNPFTSDLHVIAPAGKTAVAPGEPVGSDALADGRKVWHFKQVERADSAGFAIADYVLTPGAFATSTAGLTKPLRVWTTAKYSNSAKSMAKLVTDVVADYGGRFGPFPWPGLSVMQLENNFGGGYAPLSGVFMSRDTFGATPESHGYWVGTVELTAHEVAHQWWGNYVEPLTSADVTLSEGLAEFTSCVYTEKVFQSRSQFIRDNLSYLYQVPTKQDMALGSSGIYGSPHYVPIVYHKGATVFDMLRQEVGAAPFDQALASYATAYGRDYATIADLRAAVEKSTAKDLGWFFDQWFLKKGPIQAEVSGLWTEAGGNWTVRLRIAQSTAAKPFRFTLPVTIDTLDGKSTTVAVVVDPKGDATTVVEVASPARPVRVRLDTQRHLIRKFATGTPGDFNLSGLVDGADLVELALRYGRSMRILAKNGQEYFYSDVGWNELYDLRADLRIDDGDIEDLDQWMGTVAEPM